MRDKNKQKKKFKGYVFFDFECFVNDEGNHQVNLAIAQKVCLNCRDSLKRCMKCSEKFVCYNIQDFVKFMLKEENNHYIFIAHNGKGYDNHFIISEILKNKMMHENKLSCIMNGTKIQGMFFRNIVIKDSSLFIPTKLENFPKMFGLKELKKGYFPHSFNKPENFNYIGPYPAKEYYGYSLMTREKQIDFDKFYDQVKDKTFDFNKEIHEYCWSDVNLLTEGCLIYSRESRLSSKLNDEDEGLCPFVEKLTLASTCHYLYRRNFMKSNTISCLPASGYNPRTRCSKRCDIWLKYISEKENIYIKHIKNGGEKKIGQYWCDGICESNKTIYEYNGCMYHGCIQCFKPYTFNPIKKCLNISLYNQSNNRINKIKELYPEYNLIQFWDHDFENLLKNSQDFKNFVTKLDVSDPLNPRDALFGGRTTPFKIYHKCNNEEKIKYYDFTSLYPFVMKYGKYPIGQPKIITENFDLNKEYFGIIKAKILPPKGLYLPVLPAKINNKLVFPLCRSCSQEKIQKPEICKHTVDQRALSGTWVSLEFYEAVRRGYQILKYDEIWEFENFEQYNPTTKQGGLFTEYINSGLKQKQEASGFPAHVKTDQDKLNYISNYYDKEGIRLELQKIEKNPGLRQVAKDRLNTLWGYFGMNTNKNKFEIITSVSEWQKLLTDDRYIIKSEFFSEDGYLQVSYCERDEVHIGNNTTNVIIAAFTSAQGRLKLFGEMNKLVQESNERLLYCDTDSIFFISKNGWRDPELGDYLGEFTNELKDGEYITEFVSTGPKSYAYKVIEPNGQNHTQAVCKGFTFNNVIDLKINFDSMKEMVCNDRSLKIIGPQLKFFRKLKNLTVCTNVINKLMQFTFDKRVIENDFKTTPFGYY